MKKLILHIPHSSIHIPFKDGYVVTEEFLNSELLKLTDWYTNDLFYSEQEITITADFSRLFCDPERFPDDTQEIMSKYGMGVLYEKSDNGAHMRTISQELRERILSEYYWPHHKQLDDAVKLQLEQYSQATIIDCHSFPAIPLLRSLNNDPERPDFNIGTDLFHTPQILADISVDFFKKAGYSLGINWPYSGSIVPLRHYKKNRNVQTIMLEINRRLYLKEQTNEKSDRYPEIKSLTKAFINTIRSQL
jgi:N-formylglutamate amidohydrolase